MSEIDLFNADCLEIMENVIPDASIDLTVTSPPYDNLREYNGMTPFTFEVFKPIANALFKLTKLGGVVVWNVNDATVNGSETGSSFKQALYFKEIGFNLHDTMIWIKDGGGAVGSQKCYTQNFEYMFIFVKGRINTFNLITDKPNASFGKNKSGKGRRKPNGVTTLEIRKPNKEFSRRNNYWYIAPGKNLETGNHPAPFPYQLAHDHIISWSNAGDRIFDPFLGSGTTGAAAKQLNRNFIGTERDPEYFKIAEKRIMEAVAVEES